jgi:hypothetical protein
MSVKPGQAQYLFDNGYIPPDARPWVDHIRAKGNEATHEIPQTTPEDASKLMTMTEVLLRVVYELPTLVNAAIPSAPTNSP